MTQQYLADHLPVFPREFQAAAPNEAAACDFADPRRKAKTALGAVAVSALLKTGDRRLDLLRWADAVAFTRQMAISAAQLHDFEFGLCAGLLPEAE